MAFMYGQVVSSGKATVYINNKLKTEIKQIKVPTPEEDKNNGQSSETNELQIGLGKYYALIIGISTYDDPLITQLYRPVKDAELFYDMLTTRYTFEKENIKLLRNATIAEIDKCT